MAPLLPSGSTRVCASFSNRVVTDVDSSQMCVCVCVRLGTVLCNIEQFGQYPLQVNGFNNLDECLEGAMVERDIESLHAEHSAPSGREVCSVRIFIVIQNKVYLEVCCDVFFFFLLFWGRDGSKSCRLC